MSIPYHAISHSSISRLIPLLDVFAGKLYSLLRAQGKLVQISDMNAFSARFALCFGFGERFSLFFLAEQGNPASSPRADSTNFARAQKGPPLAERPCLW
jgi:hypothetical protein